MKLSIILTMAVCLLVGFSIVSGSPTDLQRAADKVKLFEVKAKPNCSMARAMKLLTPNCACYSNCGNCLGDDCYFCVSGWRLLWRDTVLPHLADYACDSSANGSPVYITCNSDQ